MREAFKRKDEKYALLWPSRPEFVRMAARHGAVIVPFAAVGAEDGGVVADADDVKAIPFGHSAEALLARARDVPRARGGHARDAGRQSEEAFVQPLIVPRAPERYSFVRETDSHGVFSRKRRRREKTRRENVDARRGLESRRKAARRGDDETCRASVEDGIDWLLARRSEDPFKDTPGRVIWEAAAGKQAPTFTP